VITHSLIPNSLGKHARHGCVPSSFDSNSTPDDSSDNQPPPPLCPEYEFSLCLRQSS